MLMFVNEGEDIDTSQSDHSDGLGPESLDYDDESIAFGYQVNIIHV